MQLARTSFKSCLRVKHTLINAACKQHLKSAYAGVIGTRVAISEHLCNPCITWCFWRSSNNLDLWIMSWNLSNRLLLRSSPGEHSHNCWYLHAVLFLNHSVWTAPSKRRIACHRWVCWWAWSLQC